MTCDLLIRAGLIGVAIAAPVGPIGLLCIRRTLVDGWRVGLATGLGAATADAVYGGIAALGLTAVIGWLGTGASAIHLAGGVALVLMGLRTLRSGVPAVDGQLGHRAVLNAYASTIALTMANPATIVSFIGIVASLGLDGATVSDAVTVVVGVAAGSSLWWLTLTALVAVIRRRVSAPMLRWVNRVAGIGLIAFGIVVAIPAILHVFRQSSV